MPHFDEDGYDTWICQICAKVYSSGKVNSEWRTDITGNEHAGNVCPNCIEAHKDTKRVGERLRAAVQKGPMSLYEHCRIESGLTGKALDDYINRYYGHG